MKRVLFHGPYRGLGRLRRYALGGALLALGGCATAPPPVGLVQQERLAQSIVIGQTGTAQALAALGPPASRVNFDSGYQAWLYLYASGLKAPDGGTRNAEFVVLFDPAGVAKKIRRRAPD